MTFQQSHASDQPLEPQQEATAQHPQDEHAESREDEEDGEENKDHSDQAYAEADGAAAQHPESNAKEPARPSPPHHAALSTEIYSTFTVPQKRAITLAGSFVSWFSPMSGSIYFPALKQIARDLDVSAAKVNITVSTYLVGAALATDRDGGGLTLEQIVQGVAPMMIAGVGDTAGRRSAYKVCFAIYTVANLALALQDSYYALLFLRML